MRFFDKLEAATRRAGSLVCVGLDPPRARLPRQFRDAQNGQALFNRAVIEATKDYACCYKLNLAFYEAEGPAGFEAMAETLEAIPPEIPTIADAKRGDIGSTAEQYARAIFETFQFDGSTVNVYLGGDSLEPFLAYKDKGLYILCLTSNPGAADFQMPGDLYLRVAEKAAQWNTEGGCGLVVGATHPPQMAAVRKAAPDLPFLVPGVGAQGGSPAEVAQAAAMQGRPGFIVNASRSILFASSGEDFAQAAGAEAARLRDEINAALPSA
jgi:orotidine-5'-phosphate decarboxylase